MNNNILKVPFGLNTSNINNIEIDKHIATLNNDNEADYRLKKDNKKVIIRNNGSLFGTIGSALSGLVSIFKGKSDIEKSAIIPVVNVIKDTQYIDTFKSLKNKNEVKAIVEGTKIINKEINKEFNKKAIDSLINQDKRGINDLTDNKLKVIVNPLINSLKPVITFSGSLANDSDKLINDVIVPVSVVSGSVASVAPKILNLVSDIPSIIDFIISNPFLILGLGLGSLIVIKKI